MPKITLLACLTATTPCLSTAIAQPVMWAQELAWDRTYDSPTHGAQTPLELHASPDDGLLSVQRAPRLGGTNEVLVLKYSTNGDLDWTYSATIQESGDTLWGFARVGSDVDSQGNLYICSTYSAGNGRLIKVAPDGAEIWRVTLPQTMGESYHPEFVQVDSFDRPIVGGTTMNGTLPFMTLLQVEPSGALGWREETRIGGMHGLQLSPTGQLVAFGQGDVSPWQHTGLIVSYAADGAVQWWQTVASEGYVSLGFGTSWFESVREAVIDPAGRIYSVIDGTYGGADFNDRGFQVDAFLPTGGDWYSTAVSSFGEDTTQRSLGVDDQGRVTVTGQDAATGPGEPRPFTVWHLDADGAVDWTSVPSVAQGVNGEGNRLHVRPDGRVLAFGTANSGSGDLFVEYQSDGSELATGAYSPGGERVQATDADPRGNLLLHAGIGTPRVFKWIDGGPLGTPYCSPAVANSTGLAAELRAAGQPAAAGDNVTLLARQLPPSAPVLFIISQAQGNLPGVGGGQGTLCLGAPIGRFSGPQQIRAADAGGLASLQIDLNQIPQPMGYVQAMAGSTWNVQAWYRDMNPSSTSNLTDGLSILFQ